MNVRKLVPVLFVALTLTACGTYPFNQSIYGRLPANSTYNNAPYNQPVQPVPARFQLASTHWQDVQKIKSEAKRLSTEVGKGNMTKVQAAQYLNQYRVNLVGHNKVDDSMYHTYLDAATNSQAGRISSAESKKQIQNALKIWQQAWSSMDNKPDNPAFTNFLIETMGMRPYLQ